VPKKDCRVPFLPLPVIQYIIYRCADKILSQLEMQANLSNNLNEAQPAKPSIKPYSDQVYPLSKKLCCLLL
jgi:hypothetical protein